MLPLARACTYSGVAGEEESTSTTLATVHVDCLRVGFACILVYRSRRDDYGDQMFPLKLYANTVREDEGGGADGIVSLLVNTLLSVT